MELPNIIAVDGPAASGKSTLGEILASELGYLYFDTGVILKVTPQVNSGGLITMDINQEVSNAVGHFYQHLGDRRSLFGAQTTIRPSAAPRARRRRACPAVRVPVWCPQAAGEVSGAPAMTVKEKVDCSPQEVGAVTLARDFTQA